MSAGVAALRPGMMAGGDLLLRTGSAGVLAAIALATAWFGGPATGIVAAVAAVVVWQEWTHVTGDTGLESRMLAVPVAVAILAAGFGYLGPGFVIAGGTAIGLAVGRATYWPATGMVYATLLGLSLIAVRLSAALGLTALFFVFAIVWATDTGAFFAGRTIGGPKLWPRVSPKKTWAGALGGLGAAVAAGAVVASIAGLAKVVPLLAVALLLSVAGQLGDLFESAVKRRFGVKDSGRIIPGHGGLMDRVDGLIFACALAALLGWSRGGADHIAEGLLLW